ncbi:MAG TPA: PrsW family glutamic-type intramembrane protease [Chitinophagaceae bacterium]|nr:PrsW family glutamic-type intramembrane protease [Chitinophagaceae bacterium]
MFLLALSIAPGLAIILYVYRKDSYDREPRRYLLASFFWGMVSVLPALALETAGKFFFGDMGRTSAISFYAFYAWVVVAASEEASKFAIVKWYAYPKKYFDEPFDGIMYSVMVAMGFATVENISYVQQGGFSTAILRMFLSVPAHAAFGIIMGYYIGLAKFNKEKSFFYLVTGLLLSIFFHGAFDFFLFLQDSNVVREYVSEGLLFCGALASFYLAVRLSLRSIRLHRELSRLDYERRSKLPL